MNKVSVGKTPLDILRDKDAHVDETDIVMRAGVEPEHYKDVVCLNGWIGFLLHGGAVFTADFHAVRNTRSDSVRLHNGGYGVGLQVIDNSLPYNYSPKNHNDLAQAFGRSPDYKQHTDFNGMYVGRGIYTSRYPDKNGFLFSEPDTVYSGIDLWGQGVRLDSDSNLPYLADFTNATDTTLGSCDWPLDPHRVSNKSVRLGGNKKHRPDSHNVVIHCFEGFNVELGQQEAEATHIVRYKRRWTLDQRRQHWKLYEQAMQLTKSYHFT